MNKENIVIDFKTKDNLKGLNAKSLVFDNHGMQLSAYSQLLGFNKNPTRVSIFIDRKNPEVIIPHIWSLETHEKHITMFNSLLLYWKHLKNYNPSQQQLIKLKEKNK